MEFDRKKEIVNTCLDIFVERGLSRTSTRDISKALQLQSGALYYYFESKSDAVVSCFDEALSRLETNLLHPTFESIDNPSQLFDSLISRANEMSQLVRFIVEVWTSVQYRKDISPSIDRMRKMIERYTLRVAKKYSCDVNAIRPYIIMGITTVFNYMVFGDVFPIELQIDIISKKIKELKTN